MKNEKFNVFINCISDALMNVATEVSGFEFKECEKIEIKDDRKFSVVIGVVGRNKGRILLEAGSGTVKKVMESMNEGPFDSMMDMYFCLAEFTNMFCGNAITAINNKFRGSDLRLTPPAVFAGNGMDVSTPSIMSANTYYRYGQEEIILDIGFEESETV